MPLSFPHCNWHSQFLSLLFEKKCVAAGPLPTFIIDDFRQNPVSPCRNSKYIYPGFCVWFGAHKPWRARRNTTSVPCFGCNLRPDSRSNSEESDLQSKKGGYRVQYSSMINGGWCIWYHIHPRSLHPEICCRRSPHQRCHMPRKALTKEPFYLRKVPAQAEMLEVWEFEEWFGMPHETMMLRTHGIWDCVWFAGLPASPHLQCSHLSFHSLCPAENWIWLHIWEVATRLVVVVVCPSGISHVDSPAVRDNAKFLSPTPSPTSKLGHIAPSAHTKL